MTHRHQIHVYLELNTEAETIVCRECGHELCDVGENYKEYAAIRIRSISEAGRWYRMPRYLEDAEQIEFRQFLCPSCAILFDYEIAPSDQSYLHDVDVDVDSVKSFTE